MSDAPSSPSSDAGQFRDQTVAYRTARRSRLGAIPAVAGAVAIGLVGTLPAILAGGLVVLAWIGSSPIVAFAVGQVSLAAVSETATLDSLLLAQGALAALLFEPALHVRRSIRHVLVTATGVGVLGGLAAGIWLATGTVWAPAGAIAAVVVVFGYLLHRWSLLRLGVLHDE